MLNAYLTQTKHLLQNPLSATAQIYTDADLTGYVNIARRQCALETKCIRLQGTIATVLAQRPYAFSAISIGTPAVSGIRGVNTIRSILVGIGTTGFQRVSPRPWEWFELYALNNPVPDSGMPAMWSQFAQGASGQSTGSAASGSFYVDPLPDALYTLTCDCECYPIDLVDDTTVEALPFGWTDAIPFFAARFALLSSQTGAREAEAERMFERYKEFIGTARTGANPDVLTWQSQKSSDPVQLAKIASMKGGK